MGNSGIKGASMAFKIIRNDITKVKADAIVNSANPDPVCMPGSDSAVYLAAGAEKLLEERKKAGHIKPGQVAVTPAFGLDAGYIFHTVGPVWNGGDEGERETVRECYTNCLNKAKEMGIESIAFPLISTGVYGFPKAEALLIATSVFSSFLSENDMDITLVVFDNESFSLSDKIFAGVDQFIDENYVELKTDEEYCGTATGFAAEQASASAFDGILAEDASIEPEDQEIRRRENSLRKGLFGSRLSAPARDMESAPAGAFIAKSAAVPVPKERSLEDVVKNVADTWSESLLRMIDEKGFTDTEVYKRANVDRKLFSKIRINRFYQPKKNTAVAFALALRLNVDETKDFLKRAGYAFSPSSKFDLIVEYFIDQKVYDIYTINLALFEHGQPLLGE